MCTPIAFHPTTVEVGASVSVEDNGEWCNGVVMFETIPAKIHVHEDGYALMSVRTVKFKVTHYRVDLQSIDPTLPTARLVCFPTDATLYLYDLSPDNLWCRPKPSNPKSWMPTVPECSTFPPLT